MKWRNESKFFIIFGAVIMFLMLINNRTVSAEQHVIKKKNTKEGFLYQYVDETARIIINSTNDRLLFIDYYGSEKEKECRCENTVFFKVIMRWHFMGEERYGDIIYESEHFDWNENRKICIFLPKFQKNISGIDVKSEYMVSLYREHSDLHNKGGYDDNNNYNPDGVHGDFVKLVEYYYDIGKMGVEDNWLGVGDKVQAFFECEDFYESITWSSDNEKVISVDSQGYVQAKSGGEATLSLSIEGQTIFTQKIYVEDFDMQADMSLYDNDRSKISVDGVRGTVIWKSENEDIAVVDNGYVIAKKAGVTKIIGTINGLELSFNVTVKERVLSINNISLFSGDSKKITVSGTETKVIWSSEDDTVATVNNGVVTALKPGTTKIHANTGTQDLECVVTVDKSSLKKDSISLYIDDEDSIVVKGSDYKPLFSSSDETVAKVDRAGCVSAVGVGSADITVKIADEILTYKVTVIKREAPTEFEYESSDKAIKLKWEKCQWVDYAGWEIEPVSYTVYLYDQDSKNYKIIGDTKTTWFIVEGLEPQATYNFKVAGNYKSDSKSIIEKELSEKIKCKTAKKAVKGWKVIDDKKYYYENGFKVSDIKKEIDGETYIFDEEGALQTSSYLSLDGNYFYVDSEGKVLKNQEILDPQTGLRFLADKKGKLSLVLSLKKKLTSGERYYLESMDIKNVVDKDSSDPKNDFSSDDDTIAIHKKGYIYGLNAGHTSINGVLEKITVKDKNGKKHKFMNMPVKIEIEVKIMAEPKNIKCVSDVNKVELYWDEYEGAKSFSVYIFDEASNEYKLLGKTSKNTYVAKKLQPDTKYLFKVAANIKVQGILVEQKLSKKVEAKTIKDVTGWVTEKGKKYYYKKGHPIKAGLQKIDGKLYIFASDNSLVQKAFTTLDGKLYYSDSDGVVAQNKEVKDKSSGVTYIADKNGVLKDKKDALYNTGITYTQIARTPDDYKGKYVTFTGKVYQVIEGSKTNAIRLAVNNNSSQVIWCEYSTSLTSYRILEDDYVTVYGKARGIYTYTSVLGAKISIPKVSVDIIELKS